MAKILITGHTGLAGNAIFSDLQLHFGDVIGMSSTELDLRDREKVSRVILELKPRIIINKNPK